MEPFAAVRTTGIYCRPGCSGRPKAENVTRFTFAAAAETAGYRACLLCRPYRSPQPLTRAGPEVVCRAVQLILDGALDEGSEAELGARLGVSPRHLRRLFTAQLGVTPDGLARSSRAHFARRLLDDTDLSITEVAFAAGFGSLRQFNRTCRDVFRASPSTLRARRRKADRLVADGGLSLRMPFNGALDWQAMLAHFAACAIPGVDQVDAGTYRRTIVLDGDPGVLELFRGGDDHLVLRAHLPHWEKLIHVVQRARRIASLDHDAEGPRPPGTWDAFETGVRAIIGQQLTTTAANTITGRLVARLGTAVPGLKQLGLTHTFPAPAALAEADLAGLGLRPAQENAVRSFARAVAADTVRLDRSVGVGELVASTSRLDGIGPWTAQYVALRLGEPVPADAIRGAA